MPNSRNDSGFTLLEVMVAFAIAALAISLLYDGATGGLNATATATKSEEALALARSHIAAVGRGETILQQESSGTDGDGYEWHLHIKQIGQREMTLSDSDQANDTKPTNAVLYDVQVRESWEVAGRTHEITLQTRRFDLRTAGRLMRDEGFTLLEILVAVVVLGFVVAGLVQATHFGISAWSVQNRMVDRADELERVDHVLRALVEQAAPPLAADDKPFSGLEHRLDLITRLPLQPPTDPIRRAEVVVGVDEQHRLILRWQPKPNATALKPVPPPQEIVLAEGVDHFDLTYRQAANDGGKWSKSWDDASLPSLVQMHIVLVNSSRHWPVIQAAPMLDTNGSF